MTQGYEIAKRGFRVVIPDAQYHGERMVGGPAKTHFLEFWQIIADSVAEFPKIVDYYEETTGIKDDFVGVSGLSMGGITTCALMASYDWISSAVCLMGSRVLSNLQKADCFDAGGQNVPQQYVDSQLQALRAIDLSLAPEKIAARPFHFWHGTADQIVPYKPTKAFTIESRMKITLKRRLLRQLKRPCTRSHMKRRLRWLKNLLNITKTDKRGRSNVRTYE